MGIIKCLKCNSYFESTSYGKKRKFCSIKCANSFWSNERKKKHSEKMKILYKNGQTSIKPCEKDISKKEERNCKICSKDFFVYKKSKQLYCSPECANKSPKMGGYREGSGRSKSGYFKGIYCGSTYELAWVLYRLDKNLPVKRFDGMLVSDDGKIKYYPDFIIGNNTIIEIKGYEKEENVNAKTRLAESKGYNVTILRKENLKTEFDWIKSKYGKKDHFETLYDDFKPEFKYKCFQCGKEFIKHKKAKTEKIFCSQSCCGKNICKSAASSLYSKTQT